MTDKEFRTAALEQARRHPEDIELAAFSEVQRADGGAFVELVCWVPDAEISLDGAIRLVKA